MKTNPSNCSIFQSLGTIQNQKGGVELCFKTKILDYGDVVSDTHEKVVSNCCVIL